MGYKFDSENFEKIVYESIEQNKENMDFLRAEGSRILCEKMELKNSIHELSEFIYEWYLTRRHNLRIISVDISITRRDISIFYDLLDEIFELVSFEGLAQKIINDLKTEEI